jgi:hypothetical protein
MGMRTSRACALALAAALASTACAAVADEPSAEDKAAIESLQSQGVDMSEPQLVEFLFSFRAASPARQVGKTLATEGFESKVEPAGAGSKEVLLLARKRLVLNAQEMAALRARFEDLARSAGGQYEGWGIP